MIHPKGKREKKTEPQITIKFQTCTMTARISFFDVTAKSRRTNTIVYSETLGILKFQSNFLSFSTVVKMTAMTQHTLLCDHNTKMSEFIFNDAITI